ncbi:peptide chain release factor 2 [Macrococcus epidermidis]|uniref:peptide chain release factor 2 n=1 Tax=Macrococcus epidermidis TaxID=1902580 RepID=UPI001EF2B6B7|nr:peptide chain release factor 2 [Macrococcus epidermidis]MCG7419447.1 peptide chain release factor 2 [Macrococcus epidermidis]
MEQFEINNALNEIKEKIDSFRGLFDLEEKETNIQEYEEMMADPDFWNDGDKAQEIINKNNALKEVVNGFNALVEKYENIEVLIEMLKEESDKESEAELIQQLQSLTEDTNEFELKMLLNGEFDANNAILELHPGAGGTESQDWGEMLLRMYQRFADKRGFKVETLDYLPGDEAGIKSVTILIKGHNAYGYLKAEKGVHRLVRISPFDSSGRRHTSFVSCDVTPELNNENIEIEVRTEDIKVDTYRASGAGGQHINTTDSAVRITHTPTGIVVTCQNERSQIKNRDQAMKMLKAKLYQRKIEEQEAELAAIRGEQKEIGWGSQIRSYVFHPYSMVKDHRTNAETGNTGAVMDGDLDLFIDAYLKSQL